MKTDAKTIYAQSSDIKSRTYLEYRKDMKKKAIVELEILEWIDLKLKQLYPNSKINVYKAGGDKFLWFLRKGGITREPDFIAKIDNSELKIEFQYTDKKNLKFYDFKVSKVSKKIKNEPIAINDKIFLFIHKPALKYAIFTPDWILKQVWYQLGEVMHLEFRRTNLKNFLYPTIVLSGFLTL